MNIPLNVGLECPITTKRSTCVHVYNELVVHHMHSDERSYTEQSAAVYDNNEDVILCAVTLCNSS